MKLLGFARVFNVVLLVGLVVAAGSQAVSAQELVVVEDGVARTPIVIFEDAPRFTRLAADELAEYIEKVSGARPEVIEGEPDPIPEHAVWVGYQPVMDDLFPDLDFDFQHPEEILIAANEDHLVIAGRDVWDPERLTVAGDAFMFGRGTIEGYQREYGTCNAVYTFLQDYLGVRWLWPGELGEDIPDQDTIAFAPFEYRYHPQIRQRDSIFRSYALHRWGRLGYPPSDWTRLQRLQLDSLYVPVQGHGFGDWWERFHETHPEYFALQPDGTRSGFPGPRTAKMCQSTPGVWDQWLADVEQTREKHSFRTVFNAAPNDSWASGFCICEDCRAWDHPDGELRPFHWEGLGQKYVALSDRFVTFANKLARRLKERYPDKDYYVMMHAYGHSRPGPIEATPDDNVIIGSVANFFSDPDATDRASPNDTRHRDQYSRWSELTPNIMWRPNTGNPVAWRQGGPADTAIIVDNFRFIAEKGCIGICIDTIWQWWVTQGPAYYLMAQLAWDPSRDGQAIMDDYHERGFGPAADEVKAYWSALEEARREIMAREESGYYQSWDVGFNDALFARTYALLEKARAEVADEPAVYAGRLDYVTAGLDFLRLTTENLALMERLRASDGKDREAYDEAMANWRKIEQIAEKYPHALNRNMVVHNPPGRLAAIHPDSVE